MPTMLSSWQVPPLRAEAGQGSAADVCPCGHYRNDMLQSHSGACENRHERAGLYGLASACLCTVCDSRHSDGPGLLVSLPIDYGSGHLLERQSWPPVGAYFAHYIWHDAFFSIVDCAHLHAQDVLSPSPLIDAGYLLYGLDNSDVPYDVFSQDPRIGRPAYRPPHRGNDVIPSPHIGEYVKLASGRRHYSALRSIPRHCLFCST